ncbi:MULTISPECIES: enoyl-CoA hydratase-related protein [unclassified Chelatococcus]|uniref:enoyl-CoA hydratase-related protein n=1 Tax=unclassified Chelatococcus TaxID=2638111 RepID=UPI001BCBE172|nr:MULTISPECIES: enoyl-CoA hydratase-related protein [unclassified Chelatococcus]MBS7701403.1 enoyl-CoA hydratase/isomerase family protein [Chelatococcus sp. YT9]MBX3557483.1 enoyl-CoA hydratase/isomerase family protein [Chelatococcus sp.]
MEEVLLQEIKSGVLVIQFNRPEARNAWNQAMEDALKTALLSADANPDVRAIVITGSGRTFCPGPDPSSILSGQSYRRPVTSNDDFGQRYSYMLGLRKPLIAAVNGAAAGVGLCLALYCDLRFVAEGAKLTTAFSRRGLPAEHGIAWMLPRLIGWMNASDLLISGRVINAQEAAELGLARSFPAEGFLDAVEQYAQDLARSCSPRSMMVIKRQLREAWSQSLAQATTFSNLETEASLGTEDTVEGVAHFLEKRSPRFRALTQGQA